MTLELSRHLAANLPFLFALPLVACASPAPSEPRPAPGRVAPRSAAPAVERDASGPSELRGLADYERHALATHPALRAAELEWRARAERPDVVGGLPDPSLSYAEFLEEIETRTGPQERRLGLTQPFPWPGQLGAAAREAERSADVARHQLDSRRLGVLRDVRLAFYDYAHLGRELAITAELLGLLRSLEPVVQGRIRGGAGQEDLLRLQVEIGRLEDEQASLRRRRPVLSARLADAANLWDRGALPVPQLDAPRDVSAVDLDAAWRALRDASPALAALAGELEAARAAEDVVRYRNRPTFAVGVDWFQTGDALAPVAGSGDDPVAVRLSLSLPIWSTRRGASEREAEHRIRGAAARSLAAESRLRAELEEQAFQVEDAARRIGLFRDSLIPRANEALDLTLSSYRTGGSTALDLIDAERALLGLELAYWSACRDVHQGRARLVALLGDEDLTEVPR